MIIYLDAVLADVVASLKDQVRNKARTLLERGVEVTTRATTKHELSIPKVSRSHKEGLNAQKCSKRLQNFLSFSAVSVL